MKHRDETHRERETRNREALCEAFASLAQAGDVNRFLEDLCTPAEIEAMADRWRVAVLLAEGLSYRDVRERTGVSVTTVGRVARCKDMGAGGYRAALNKRESS